MGNTQSIVRYYAEKGYENGHDIIVKGYNAILNKIGKSNADLHKPGKPTPSDTRSSDSVVLFWEKPESVYPHHRYQIRYRAAGKEEWSFHDEQPRTETIVMTNLRSKTNYTFQVRMVNTDIEGPYSEPSDLVETLETAADRYLEMTYKLQASNEPIPLRYIPLKEVNQPEGELNKIRRFELGEPEKATASEKTIILLGATGTGKKQFIDGLINYCLAVHWEDHQRFTVTKSDADTNKDGWTTCYAINPLPGGRLDFRLNIIETHGFDVDDENRCKDILQQLQYLYTSQVDKIEFIDAVCFMVKAQDTQLSTAQINTFRSVLTSMGADLEENICLITTFADCKQPPIIQSLEKAGISKGKLVPSNTAGLFVPNRGADLHSLSPFYWKIGQECFKFFIEHLAKLPQKAPMPVLPDRHELEDLIENLQPLLTAELNEVVQLKEEKKIIEDNKTEIETQNTFTYTIKEKKLIKKDHPESQYVTNCLNCYITCHLVCQIPRNEDKHGCWAMDKNTGHCTQCFEKCHWTSHANTPYIYEYVEEVKTITYVEKENTYRRTPDEEMTVEKVVDRMGDHLKDLDKRIHGKVDEIRVHVNLLRRISKRHDTMTLHDQIDLLIQGEEKKREIDYEKRIEVLRELKKF